MEALRGLGFTDRQATVYALLLRLGRCSVRDLASATGFSRITIQSILEKFEGLQIVCGVYEGKKKRVYSPNNPQHLRTLLDEQIGKLKQQREDFDAVLAEALVASDGSPNGFGVHALRGMNGLAFLVEDAVRCGQEVCIVGDISVLSPQDYEHIANVAIGRLLTANVPIRFLLLDSAIARRFAKDVSRRKGNTMVKVRFTSARDTPIAMGFGAYADRVVFANAKNVTIAMIQDDIISSVFRFLFMENWEKSSPLSGFAGGRKRL